LKERKHRDGDVRIGNRNRHYSLPVRQCPVDKAVVVRIMRSCPIQLVDSSAIQRRSTRRSIRAESDSEPRTGERIVPPEMRRAEQLRRAVLQPAGERTKGFSSSFRHLRNCDPSCEPRTIIKQALEPFAEQKMTPILFRLCEERQ